MVYVPVPYCHTCTCTCIGCFIVKSHLSDQGKGEYGIEVTKIARPLPLEYLIVELTTTTPLRPKPTLPGGRGDPFPIENRDQLGEIQVQ